MDSKAVYRRVKARIGIYDVSIKIHRLYKGDYGIPLGPSYLHIKIQRATMREYDADNAIVGWRQGDSTMATMRLYDDDNAIVR
ncbi:hypothetical protein DPMN_094848 [Dreissena polymorpha]|uniref:Uncharacterized protein n=1 Tax=Dreissena polymorpha TaxID=45954 RepID=A0A9D4L855_DREPO|nr:hypothetical protein DPMN_094848 [Dreissena polymorpha]